jgi:hypothetical protein
VKLRVTPVLNYVIKHYVIKTCWTVEVWLTILNLTVEGAERSASRPAALIPGKQSQLLSATPEVYPSALYFHLRKCLHYDIYIGWDDNIKVNIEEAHSNL